MQRGTTLGLFVFILLTTFGCVKDTTGIPNVYIDIPPISLHNPDYSKLLAPNNFVFLEGGVAGIVVYNTGRGGYVAYDRCSTVNPDERNALVIDDDTGFNLVDPVSGAKFDLATGFPTKKPAEKALLTYSVIITGNGYILRVTN